jgi:cytochrome c peroxidase
MHSESLARGRRWCGAGLVLASGLGLMWFFSPGLPVLWGPRASAALKEAGKTLFEHDWQPSDPLAGGDGLGPVFNARSCVACHFQGGVGGGGPNQRNVLTFETRPSLRDPEIHQGVVHTFAVEKSYKETEETVRRLFPVIPGGRRTVHADCGSATVQVPDFNPVRMESVNTTALFGAGWIDRISTKSITHNHTRQLLDGAAREFQMDFSALDPGRARILADGRVGKFGWKAQFATLEEFVAAACANEMGLGNPLMEQAKPLRKPDYPAVPPDLDRKQFAALVAYVDTLPRPVEMVPEDPREQDRALRGKGLFYSIGCAVCHTPDVGGVKGVYSDFLLHRVEDPSAAAGGSDSYGNGPPPPQALPLPDEHPLPAEWKTPPLWGVANSAPYFHDGRAPTLKAAILRHAGSARRVTEAYKQLPRKDQEALVVFLKTLQAPPDADPASGSVQTAKR